MGWATAYIERLRCGETVQFRPRGQSMVGKIESGQLCTVVPIDEHTTLAVGDIVLCNVHGDEYLHLIKAIRGATVDDMRLQIGNNRGYINGWIGMAAVYGRCVNIED
jgi:hypothetical protein